jgi:hypothetical protein
MSLEEKLANLTLDDSASVVETVKSGGVEKSGLAANISVLVARCGSKDDAEALAAMKTVKALAEGIPASQPFTKDCLGACKFGVRHAGELARLHVGMGGVLARCLLHWIDGWVCCVSEPVQDSLHYWNDICRLICSVGSRPRDSVGDSQRRILI